MTRRVYLYFALTFLLGVMVGGTGVLFYGWYSGHWHRGFNKERLVRHLERELNLSQTQVQQLNQMMDGSGEKVRNLQKQIGPQFQAIRDDTNNRIRQILSPEQLAKFNDLVARWEKRRSGLRSP